MTGTTACHRAVLPFIETELDPEGDHVARGFLAVDLLEKRLVEPNLVRVRARPPEGLPFSAAAELHKLHQSLQPEQPTPAPQLR